MSTRRGLAAVASVALMAGCGGAPTTPSCRYTVSPSEIAVPPQGGTTSVSVSTADSCPWTVALNVTWVAVLVTAPTRTGNGVVQLFASPNTGAARSGTLAVAGQTVTVSQAAPALATLSGRVKEAWIDSGLAGVTVEAISGPTIVTTTTASDGTYAMANLPAGTYRISFSKPSYTPVVQTVVVVTETILSPVLNAAITFPFTAADLSGGWAAGGPYPNEPMRLTLLQNGSSLTGYYVDRHDYSDTLTGSHRVRA
jgi:hypothetical protein